MTGVARLDWPFRLSALPASNNKPPGGNRGACVTAARTGALEQEVAFHVLAKLTPDRKPGVMPCTWALSPAPVWPL